MPQSEKVIRISGLHGGISKQPAHLRHANQVEDAKNAVFSVVDGVSKRPGTVYVTTDTAWTTTSSLRMHAINRDPDEQYLVVFGVVA